MVDGEDLTVREKVRALKRVGEYRPGLTAGIVLFSVMAALLEGIGLTFLVPIIEIVQDPQAADEADGMLGWFVDAYGILGIPFTLEFVVLGVIAVMSIRYTTSFLNAWFQIALRTYYVRHLQTELFERALDAEVAYYDDTGTDDVLNAIVTQAEYAGKVIRDVVKLFEQALLCLMYLAITFYLAPALTVGVIAFFAVLTYLIRYVLEPGYTVGDRVAEANEEVQQSVQAGVQGIRDVKLFHVGERLFSDFSRAIDKFATSNVALGRNEAAIQNFYTLSSAVMLFVVIYAAFTFTTLSLAGVGVFLFAMFQLAPRVSTLNNKLYKVEGRLPHMVRTQEFVDELERRREGTPGDESPPDPVTRVEFDDVSFGYDDETVVEDVSVAVERGEFVGFAGQSGAGKSTLVSLLARLYEPDSGEIRADGTPIDRFDVDEWRSRVAVVRQDPYVFNDTLRYNLTVGAADVSRAELDRACEAALVTEFLDDLPEGYDTQLGENGVRLSGGQRQRISLARALLKDADVLVLDEATSDLDTGIEREIQRKLRSLDGEYAVVAIAHRLSTISDADRIYTMEDGRIVEAGDHEELMTNDRTYARLYSMQ